MKYIIQIYENGSNVATNTSSYNYDYDWLESNYEQRINDYIKRGYKELRSNSSSSKSYVVLFNEDELLTACVGVTYMTVTDYIDITGDAIVLDELLVSEVSGDVYSLHEFNHNVYIRNVSKFEPHIIKSSYGLEMSMTVGDKYKFDQDYINTLQLRRK